MIRLRLKSLVGLKLPESVFRSSEEGIGIKTSLEYESLNYFMLENPSYISKRF